MESVSGKSKKLEAVYQDVTSFEKHISARKDDHVNREHWDNPIMDFATKCLNRLLFLASELFFRMHANEVYKVLSMGQKEGVICW